MALCAPRLKSAAAAEAAGWFKKFRVSRATWAAGGSKKVQEDAAAYGVTPHEVDPKRLNMHLVKKMRESTTIITVLATVPQEQAETSHGFRRQLSQVSTQNLCVLNLHTQVNTYDQAATVTTQIKFSPAQGGPGRHRPTRIPTGNLGT